ncbi:MULTISPECIES: NADPH-dependent F420 reductase [unclassified Flavobacterium]|uniref:NADPH-dependent F420 reductase n=1 Tax=unclassified Flavobacterium TaxID=196869 RepID=UPI001F1389EE|nr:MULTISPECIES: NAD(P)-binding domain-containing protein [unclassified Flavobacterium]UMY65644.1 NAD(P)-binding domain-containing protein [Flavobacterium sp. HJ-32-4]
MIPYRIAVIGLGNVGAALARNWKKAGHTVVFGAQFPLSDKSRRLVDEFGESRFLTVTEAIAQSQVILLATPAAAVIELADALGGDLSHAVIIDATNAIMPLPNGYATAFHFLAEHTNARLVKCFNSTGFENMADPLYADQALDMFMAGDNVEAKQVARQLALDCGFGTCIDFGKADKVELLEKFALSWINLAIMQGMGRGIAFRLLHR